MIEHNEEDECINDKYDSPRAVRVPTKQLVAMMLAGQNGLVLKYLRNLPPAEFQNEKAQLIKQLELIQKSRRGMGTSRSASAQTGTKRSKSKNEEGGTTALPAAVGGGNIPATIAPAGVGSAVGGTGKEAPRRKFKVRKRIHSSPPGDGGVPSQPPNAADAQTKMIHKYKLDTELGRGMFAVVYRGIDTETGTPVAIKCIDKEAVDPNKLPTLRREAELLEKLNHPNIVKIYHVDETKKKIALVLEYMDKGSLYKILRKFGPMPEEVVSVFTREALTGLHYLHQQSVIHRDIKAGNILINKKAEVKLADFGTAKPEDQNKSFTVIGTPYWMAPEVIELTGGGSKSDIWSLGCTVIELLTGNPPYFELSTMQALFNIVEEEHPPLPSNIGLSKEIQHFLLWCFVKDPKKRPTAIKLLSHPFIENSKHIGYDSIEEVQNKIKKHNINKQQHFSDVFGQAGNPAAAPVPAAVSQLAVPGVVLAGLVEGEVSQLNLYDSFESDEEEEEPVKGMPTKGQSSHRNPSACVPLGGNHNQNHKRNTSEPRKLELQLNGGGGGGGGSGIASPKRHERSRDNSRENSKEFTSRAREQLITDLIGMIAQKETLLMENEELRKTLEILTKENEELRKKM